MIAEEKLYSEEFAIDTFNLLLRNDLIDDCAKWGFNLDFLDYNNIVLGRFQFDAVVFEILLDAINAKIIIKQDQLIIFTDNFSGLTDRVSYLIGIDGIVTEFEYINMFCNLLRYFRLDMQYWVHRALGVNVWFGSRDMLPWQEITIIK